MIQFEWIITNIIEELPIEMRMEKIRFL